jgi:hypothetical protein
MSKLTSIFILFAVCSSALVQAQDSILILGNPASDILFLKELDGFTALRRKEISRFDLHTSFVPGISHSGLHSVESTRDIEPDESSRSRGYLYRKLRLEHFIKIDTGGFYLLANPSFNYEAGKDLIDESGEQLYVNTRGLSFHGSIGGNVSFYSRVYENQAFLPTYLDDFVAEYGVIPGQGRIKTFKETGYDYAMSSGVVSFSPNKRLNIQFGNGKQFLGDGYRSLALSRNAFNYPFLKISTWFGPVQYTNLFMSLQNLNVILPTSAVTERRFQKKVGTIHHLDWAITDQVTIGVFEQMIWGAFEMDGDAWSFINPVPFIRPMQYGLSDENNVLLGMNSKVMLPSETMIYGQLVIDDLKANKNGFQLGIKSWAINRLTWRLEFNQVSPCTYAHADSTRNFAHYNQALAHPLGAGFLELSSSASYTFRDFFIVLRANYASYYDDEGQYHWGTDIFRSDKSKSQSRSSAKMATLLYQSVRVGYEVNPVTGMRISFGFNNRTEKTVGGVGETQYMFLSFSANIPNRIYDF